jgi:predicted RNase H-like HicB family nuclease
MHKYAVVDEPTATGYSAYARDLPGCIATGHVIEQTPARMAEAVEAHLQALREDGDPIPVPPHAAGRLLMAWWPCVTA